MDLTLRRPALRLLALLMLLVAALAARPLPARADPGDITAASRSVVRVVLVASDGNQVFYVGHGSGVAVAPNRILTNAHVVAPMAEDPSIVIGIVPSEGGKSFGAKVIAYSPGNDLALLEILDGGRVTPAALFSGPVDDGAGVFAIGYPGTVDRAQGLDLADIIKPQSPVRTPGSVSGGRSAKNFDTILHTAPIGGGSSGGPLVDACGRVIGINSFGSLSDGSDAEFFFAVSAREIAPFLRKAGVAAQTVGSACRSVADLTRAEADREAAAAAAANAKSGAEREKLAAEAATARRQAELNVIAERENYLAFAGLLLALSVVGFGASAMMFSRGKSQPGKLAAGGGAFLMLAAIACFLGRPNLSEIDERSKLPEAEASEAIAASANGKYVCRLIPERSRITVSDEPSVPLAWKDGGCVNGRTQYGPEGQRWVRILVPNEEATVTVAAFSPDSRTYSVSRYMLPLDAMQKIRTIRQRYTIEACTADQTKVTQLADMQTALRSELPAQPNELLTYDCSLESGPSGAVAK